MDKVDNSKKIAIFGGTFDPIHMGHIEIALAAQEQFALDEVHFVTAKASPFKLDSTSLSAEERFDLVGLALKPYTAKNFIASRVELERDDISYTYETVKYFKAKYPHDQIYFILGTDTYENLYKWKEYDYLKANLDFLLYIREPFTNQPIKDNTRVNLIKGPMINKSSSLIKESLQGNNVNTHALGLVPEEIKDQVYDHYAK